MTRLWAGPTFVILVAAWICLNGELTVGNVVAGAIVAFVVLVLFPFEAPRWGHQLHPVALARLLGFIAVSLVVSSAQVVRAVLWPTPARLRAGIVRVDLEDSSPLVLMIVANAITLTPGTLTVTARESPAVLHVHVLGLGDDQEFRDSIVDLQERVAAALTPVARSAP